MPRTFPSKEARDTDRLLRDQGWAYVGRDGRGHLAYVHPSGARISAAGSPSDVRNVRNLLALAARRVTEEEGNTSEHPRMGRAASSR